MNEKNKKSFIADMALILCLSMLLAGCGENIRSKKASLTVTLSSASGTKEVTADGYTTSPKAPTANKASKIPFYSAPAADQTYEYYHCDNAVNVQNGQVISHSRFVEKYSNEGLEWTVYLEEEFEAVNCIGISDGVLTYGITYGTDGSPKLPVIVKLSSEGELIWSKLIPLNATESSIGMIFETVDGGYDFVGISDSTKLFFGRLSSDGELTLSVSNEVGNISPSKVIKTSKGYAILYTSENPARPYGIITIGNDGKVTNDFSYGSDDQNIVITSIIEFEGKLCISAYALPKSLSSASQKSEIANIVDEVPYSDTGMKQNRDLFYTIKDLYVAHLLICNYDTGELESFFSAEGSIGGVLYTDENSNLVWKVECLAIAYYAAKTSIYTVNGSSYVYDYVFNSSLELSDVIDCKYLFYFAK